MKIGTIFIIVLLISVCRMANAGGSKYEDLSITKKGVGNSCLYTFDVRITEKLASEEDLILDHNYDNIRSDGVIMQVYYSNVLGKAQWTQFPFPNNIYLMPGSILLPIQRWLEHGMKSDGSWWVRVVLLNSKSC